MIEAISSIITMTSCLVMVYVCHGAFKELRKAKDTIYEHRLDVDAIHTEYGIKFDAVHNRMNKLHDRVEELGTVSEQKHHLDAMVSQFQEALEEDSQ